MRNQDQKFIKESMKMISNKYLALFGLAMTLGIPAAHAVDFGAFGDVSYQGTTEKNTADSFVQGQFDLYTTQKIDPKTKVFVEMVFEAGDDNAYGLDLERLNITRQLTPGFSLAWGRFHTPIGYWNTAYHHGALIQDTVLRPTFLDFEDGSGAIFPTHIIGIMADGKMSTGGGDLEYMLALGNGSSINTQTPGATEIDVHNVVDTQDKKMVVGAVNYNLSSMPLRVGVFALHDPFAESGAAGSTASGVGYGSDLVGMTVWGADVRYASHRFDMIAESYNITNKDKVGNAGSNDASAYYVQFGYRVNDQFKTIYRFENVDYLTKDPYFMYLGTPEGSRHVVDLRYDLDDTNALKFEVARFEPVQSGMKSYTFYALQWAFLML
jgi:hypothetical protein